MEHRVVRVVIRVCAKTPVVAVPATYDRSRCFVSRCSAYRTKRCVVRETAADVHVLLTGALGETCSLIAIVLLKPSVTQVIGLLPPPQFVPAQLSVR